MRGLIAATAIALLLTAACSSGNATSSTSRPRGTADATEPVATSSVDLPKSYKYVPPAIVIDAGTTVTWTNHDDFPHTVTLKDGSGVDKHLGVGQSATITFDRPGSIAYTCSLHPAQMRGSILVRSA
jgi:plastocyanin